MLLLFFFFFFFISFLSFHHFFIHVFFVFLKMTFLCFSSYPFLLSNVKHLRPKLLRENNKNQRKQRKTKVRFLVVCLLYLCYIVLQTRITNEKRKRCLNTHCLKKTNCFPWFENDFYGENHLNHILGDCMLFVAIDNSSSRGKIIKKGKAKYSSMNLGE